jgi:hypothetical protein
MLTKLYASRYIEGTPEVPYRAAHTECGQTPAPGYYRTVCEGMNVPVGYQCTNGGVTSPTHDHSTDPLVYQFIPTGPCRSEWIQTGPPGPLVCTSYPEQPHVPAVPPRLEYAADYGWNAGGNSTISQSGDFLIRDTMGRVAGVTWGIVASRDGVPNPARITHGFLFSQNGNGQPQFAIVEGGQSTMSARPYAADDEFAIRRVGARVTYFHNDSPIYTSTRPSNGTAWVGSSLYGSGDAIP